MYHTENIVAQTTTNQGWARCGVTAPVPHAANSCSTCSQLSCPIVSNTRSMASCRLLTHFWSSQEEEVLHTPLFIPPFFNFSFSFGVVLFRAAVVALSKGQIYKADGSANRL